MKKRGIYICMCITFLNSQPYHYLKYNDHLFFNNIPQILYKLGNKYVCMLDGLWKIIVLLTTGYANLFQYYFNDCAPLSHISHLLQLPEVTYSMIYSYSRYMYRTDVHTIVYRSSRSPWTYPFFLKYITLGEIDQLDFTQYKLSKNIRVQNKYSVP